MGETELVLGIDSSTQSVSAVAMRLCDFSEEAQASIHYRDMTSGDFGIQRQGPPILPPRAVGQADQPVALFLAALEELLAKLGPCLLGRVRAINVSAQQHGQVWLGRTALKALADLRLVGAGLPDAPDLAVRIVPGLASDRSPIWMSWDAEPQAAAMRNALGGIENAVAISGSDFPCRFSGPVLARRGRLYPEQYAKTERIHLISSFLSGILAGHPDAPIDWGNGSGTGLMDWAGRCWSPKLLAAAAANLPGQALHLSQKLPCLTHPLTIIGPISAYFVERFGFVPNCVVIAGSGDNPQSKVMAEGTLLSLGTSFVIMCPGEQPHASANAMYDGLGRPFLFGCRTNGALAWEAIRAEAGLAPNDFVASEAALETECPSRKIRIFQPQTESFPRSPALDTGKLADFAQNYAAVVDSSLGLMALQVSAFAASSNEIVVTGGAAASHAVLRRIAGIWNARTIAIGSAGAAAGAAIAAACALARQQGASELEITALARKASRSMSPNRAMIDPTLDSVAAYRQYLTRLNLIPLKAY